MRMSSKPFIIGEGIEAFVLPSKISVKIDEKEYVIYED